MKVTTHCKNFSINSKTKVQIKDLVTSFNLKSVNKIKLVFSRTSDPQLIGLSLLVIDESGKYFHSSATNKSLKELVHNALMKIKRQLDKHASRTKAKRSKNPRLNEPELDGFVFANSGQ